MSHKLEFGYPWMKPDVTFSPAGFPRVTRSYGTKWMENNVTFRSRERALERLYRGEEGEIEITHCDEKSIEGFFKGTDRGFGPNTFKITQI